MRKKEWIGEVGQKFVPRTPAQAGEARDEWNADANAGGRLDIEGSDDGKMC